MKIEVKLHIKSIKNCIDIELIGLIQSKPEICEFRKLLLYLNVSTFGL